jgi:hypothetical protein
MTSAFLWPKPLFKGFLFVVGLVLALQVQGGQPIVAIHDSELTRALETMPATGGNSFGTGNHREPVVGNQLALFCDAGFGKGNAPFRWHGVHGCG